MASTCRLFAALALALLLTAPAFAQRKTDLEKEHLLGAVRSVRSQMLQYFDDKQEKPWRVLPQDAVFYDASGNETARDIYDDYGFPVGKEVSRRDADGNRVESTLTDPKGAVMDRRVFTYENGRGTQVIEYDGKGNASLKQIFSYDAKERLREEVYYDPTVARAKTVYKYDEQSRLSEAAFFLSDGSKATAPIGPCLGAHRVVYFYDEKGRLVKTVAYEDDGELKRSWQNSYDAKGEIAETITDDSWSTVKYTYRYEYDSQGNWIKKIRTTSHQPKLLKTKPDQYKTVTVREIVYY